MGSQNVYDRRKYLYKSNACKKVWSASPAPNSPLYYLVIRPRSRPWRPAENRNEPSQFGSAVAESVTHQIRCQWRDIRELAGIGGMGWDKGLNFRAYPDIFGDWPARCGGAGSNVSGLDDIRAAQDHMSVRSTRLVRVQLLANPHWAVAPIQKSRRRAVPPHLYY